MIPILYNVHSNVLKSRSRAIVDLHPVPPIVGRIVSLIIFLPSVAHSELSRIRKPSLTEIRSIDR
jgi:hypothetical protein